MTTALPDAGALGDPFIGSVDHALQLFIGENPFGQERSGSGEKDVMHESTPS
jgi:hypothetical protein